jgi:hypothetical protein
LGFSSPLDLKLTGGKMSIEEFVIDEVYQPKKILDSTNTAADENELCEKMDFSVTVCRTAYGCRTFKVMARSKKEACDKAIEMAGNYEFSTHYADYVVEGIDV